MKPYQVLPAIGLVVCSSVCAQAQGFDEIAAAATRLKEAKVTREYDHCVSKGSAADFCREAIAQVGKKEQDLTFRLMALVASLPVYKEQLSKEYLACSDPVLTYSLSVWCVDQLVQRLVAAKDRQFLVLD